MDTLVSYRDSRDARQNAGNPYVRYPERDSWTLTQIFERPDGSRYQVGQRVHRWGSTSCAERPVQTEL